MGCVWCLFVYGWGVGFFALLASLLALLKRWLASYKIRESVRKTYIFVIRIWAHTLVRIAIIFFPPSCSLGRRHFGVGRGNLDLQQNERVALLDFWELLVLEEGLLVSPTANAPVSVLTVWQCLGGAIVNCRGRRSSTRLEDAIPVN